MLKQLINNTIIIALLTTTTVSFHISANDMVNNESHEESEEHPWWGIAQTWGAEASIALTAGLGALTATAVGGTAFLIYNKNLPEAVACGLVTLGAAKCTQLSARLVSYLWNKANKNFFPNNKPIQNKTTMKTLGYSIACAYHCGTALANIRLCLTFPIFGIICGPLAFFHGNRGYKLIFKTQECFKEDAQEQNVQEKSIVA